MAIGGLDSSGLTGCGRFRLARRARAVAADFAGGVPWAAERVSGVERGRNANAFRRKESTEMKMASLTLVFSHFFSSSTPTQGSNRPPRSLEEWSLCSPIRFRR